MKYHFKIIHNDLGHIMTDSKVEGFEPYNSSDEAVQAGSDHFKMSNGYLVDVTIVSYPAVEFGFKSEEDGPNYISDEGDTPIP